MNRSESLERWRRIAAGALNDSEPCDPIDADLHEWIRQVAARVLEVEAGGETGMRRQQAIIIAVGLSGKLDGYASLRVLANEAVWDFMPDDMLFNTIIRDMVETARQRGLLSGIYADDHAKARKLMRDIVRNQI